MLPILYSFRRCPYAIRARMALAYAGINYELREVSLRHKPAEMLAISPKGTTPVLQLPDGRVLEESLDIMRWSIEQHDPDHWDHDRELGNHLIATNDREFKQNLDRYKYFNRFPEEPMEVHRRRAEADLLKLEELLQQRLFLLSDRISLTDVAIFPFVRQFAHVDWEWFQHQPYQHLQRWLHWHESSELFQNAIQKVEIWSPTPVPLSF